MSLTIFFYYELFLKTQLSKLTLLMSLNKLCVPIILNSKFRYITCLFMYLYLFQLPINPQSIKTVNRVWWNLLFIRSQRSKPQNVEQIGDSLRFNELRSCLIYHLFNNLCIHIPEIDTAMYRVAGLQINKIVVLFIKSLWFHQIEETPKFVPMYELN